MKTIMWLLKGMAMFFLIAGLGIWSGWELWNLTDNIADWNNLTTEQYVQLSVYGSITLGSLIGLIYLLFSLFSGKD